MRLDSSFYNIGNVFSSVIDMCRRHCKHDKYQKGDKLLHELRFTNSKILELVATHNLSRDRKVKEIEKAKIINVCEQIILLRDRYMVAIGKVIIVSALGNYKGKNWFKIGFETSKTMMYVKPILNSLKEPDHHCV